VNQLYISLIIRCQKTKNGKKNYRVLACIVTESQCSPYRGPIWDVWCSQKLSITVCVSSQSPKVFGVSWTKLGLLIWPETKYYSVCNHRGHRCVLVSSTKFGLLMWPKTKYYRTAASLSVFIGYVFYPLQRNLLCISCYISWTKMGDLYVVLMNRYELTL
jgi:hypothetical protein